MPAAADQGLIDGRFADPSDRYVCRIFDAVAAFVLPEIAGLGAAEVGGALGGFSALGGGEIAGLTAGEVLGGGAGALLGGGEALAGGLGEVLGAGAGDIAGGIGGGVGGVGAAGPATIGAGADVAGAISPVTAGTSVAGPVAAAPSLPASIAYSPTAIGDLTAGTTAGATPGAAGATGAVGATGSATPGLDLTGADFSNTIGESTDVTTGAAAKSGSGIDRAISSLTGGNLNKSDLGTILSGGGLLMNVLGGQKKLPGEAQINRAAGNLEATAAGQAALGTQLESFLQSGKLPPGLQTGLRSATEAAKTTIRSQYAQRGMSGSSAEAQDMQNAEDRAVAAGQQVALQLLQQGASMVGQAANTEGMAAQLYQAILADALNRDHDLGSAIGSFSSALAGSGGGNTITVKAA